MLLFLIGSTILLMYGSSKAENLYYAQKQEVRIANQEVPRITAFEAKKLFDKGKLILVHAQERENFETAHLYGSIFLDINKLEQAGFDLPRDLIVAFYCS
jgi:hypothetical protein